MLEEEKEAKKRGKYGESEKYSIYGKYFKTHLAKITRKLPLNFISLAQGFLDATHTGCVVEMCVLSLFKVGSGHLEQLSVSLSLSQVLLSKGFVVANRGCEELIPEVDEDPSNARDDNGGAGSIAKVFVLPPNEKTGENSLVPSSLMRRFLMGDCSARGSTSENSWKNLQSSVRAPA